MSLFRIISFLLFILVGCASCSTPINLTEISQSGDYCQPISYSTAQTDHYLSSQEIAAIQIRHAHFSQHNLYTANALGIISNLIKLDSLYQEGKTTDQNISSPKMKILEKIQRVSEEMNGLAATLDCEGEKTDQIAHYLDKENNKRNNKITIASIVMASITTIATVAIDKNATQNTVAIGGGILSSELAALTINPAGKKVRWFMDKNLLETIWDANDTLSVIPSSIWYMLNQNTFSNSQKITLVESIKQRWLHINFQDEISAEDQKKFFGKGGIYTAEDLHMRANMLNELQATIRSLHQDLSSLTLALSTYPSTN